MTARRRSFLVLFKSFRLALCFAHYFNLTHHTTTTTNTTASPKMHADCLPGAAVTVRVNGIPLIEHATENCDLSATTFVEAVAGAEFDVALNLRHGFAYRAPADRIRFCVYVDGEFVKAPIISTHLQYVAEYLVEGPEETKNGVTTSKRLTFAQHASSM